MKLKRKVRITLWILVVIFLAIGLGGIFLDHHITDWTLKLFISSEINLNYYRTAITFISFGFLVLAIITLAIDEYLADREKEDAAKQ